MPVPDCLGESQSFVEVATPPRPAGPTRRDAGRRGLELFEVPVSLLAGGDEGPLALQDDGHQPLKKTRPTRNRMKPLEAWRNERILYERLPGSDTPSVRGAVLNVAGAPGDERPALVPLQKQGLAEDSDGDYDLENLPPLKALEDGVAVMNASRRQFLREARASEVVE